jgi:hypothetical protein
MANAPGMIDHRILLTQVRNTAPFLFDGVDETGTAAETLADLARRPRGWLAILRRAAAWPQDKRFKPTAEDYFCLCLAAHHATVGTYVPTDVDSKIRAHLWRGLQRETLARRVAIARAARGWAIDGINARVVVMPGHAVVSGHDGEHLAVAVAAWGALLAAGDAAGAAEMEAVIAGELAREAAAFTAALAGDLVDALRLAAILTHNVGDIDQGLGGWADKPGMAEAKARFARVAHRGDGEADGECGAGLPDGVLATFTRAARLYKAAMAPEGHRNYPLRAVRELRASADFLLPIAPFLDGWGRMLAGHAGLGVHGCAEVVTGLVAGWRKVPGQQGYQRALAGLFAGLASPAPLLRRLDDDTRAGLTASALVRAMAVPEEEFLDGMRARARVAVG